jgi:hypothetical protein
MQRMKTTVLSLCLILAACGGGGGSGDSTAGGNGGGNSSGNGDSNGTSPVMASCQVEYLPQGRMMDLDKSGYVFFDLLKVTCPDANGTQQPITGLSAASFQLTGNGVTNTAPEDMVAGTSSTDGTPTYVIQNYRHFASAAAVTANAETLTVSGTDTQGKPFSVSSSMNLSNTTQAIDDLYTGNTLASNRVIDADGKGYTATMFVVAYGAQNGSTSAPCPTSTSVKDYPLVSTNASSQTRDMRYCLYTGLTTASFYFTGVENSWKWNYGANTGTLPATLTVNGALVSPSTLNGNRVPIYKVVSSVRFSIAPMPNFVTEEAPFGLVSNPGRVAYDTVLQTNNWTDTTGAIWY